MDWKTKQRVYYHGQAAGGQGMEYLRAAEWLERLGVSLARVPTEPFEMTEHGLVFTTITVDGRRHFRRGGALRVRAKLLTKQGMI